MQLSIFNSLLPQVFTSQLNVFSFKHNPKSPYTISCVRCLFGGLKWTRTIDLTLIRRVL